MGIEESAAKNSFNFAEYSKFLHNKRPGRKFLVVAVCRGRSGLSRVALELISCHVLFPGSAVKTIPHLTLSSSKPGRYNLEENRRHDRVMTEMQGGEPSENSGPQLSTSSPAAPAPGLPAPRPPLPVATPATEFRGSQTGQRLPALR